MKNTNRREEFLADFVSPICEFTHRYIKNSKKEAIIIDALAELEINNVDYQIQIHLEPRKKDWVPNDRFTARIIED